MAQTREFAQVPAAESAGRGYLVQFEARMSQTAAKADEWVRNQAGQRGAAGAWRLGGWWPRSAACPLPPAFANADVEAAATAADICVGDAGASGGACLQRPNARLRFPAARHLRRATACRLQRRCWR